MIVTESVEPIPPKDLLEISSFYGPQEGRGYGCRVEVISPLWEGLFKQISEGKTTLFKKDGFEGELYNFPQADMDRQFYALHPSVRSLFDEDGYGKPNLFFLRMKGIEKGVKIHFKGMFEKDIVRKFTYQAADESLSLYMKLIGGSVKAKVVLD